MAGRKRSSSSGNRSERNRKGARRERGGRVEREKVIAVVEAAKSGFWSPGLNRHLAFTKKRLIVAKRGLLGSWGALIAGIAAFYLTEIMTDSFLLALSTTAATVVIVGALTIQEGKNIRKELEKLSPDEILVASERNYEIPYSKVTTVEMKKWGKSAKVLFWMGGEVHGFTLELKFEDAVKLARSVLGDKVLVE